MGEKRIKLAIVGCGNIGEKLAYFIEEKLKDKVYLYAIWDKVLEKAEFLREKLKSLPKILELDKLVKEADFIIESASIEAASKVLEKALLFKKDVLILSVGAFIKRPKFISEIEKSRINVYVASGAILGVDGLLALSLGKVKSLELITTKPPQGFIGVDYLKNKGINIEKIKEERIIFEGKVEEAIKYFPQNINVAATLFLAASFFKKDFSCLKVFIKVNPKIKTNLHKIKIESEEAHVEILIRNQPSKINPKTSTLAILSAEALLYKIFSSFKLGS